jgi:hypothetical protein
MKQVKNDGNNRWNPPIFNLEAIEKVSSLFQIYFPLFFFDTPLNFFRYLIINCLQKQPHKPQLSHNKNIASLRLCV